MSVDLHQLLEKYGCDFLCAALKQLVGQPAEAVHDEKRYKARVAAASWRAAPMQIRLLSPDQLRWDDFCLELRDRVYTTGSGSEITSEIRHPYFSSEIRHPYFSH